MATGNKTNYKTWIVPCLDAWWGADYNQMIKNEDVFGTSLPADWSTHAPG